MGKLVRYGKADEEMGKPRTRKQMKNGESP